MTITADDGERVLKIRIARVPDAASACLAIRLSISELCGLDHENDPTVLEHWLSNKTPEYVAQWIVANPASALIAELDGRVAGMGLVRPHGYILLNYVAPWARFQRVSKSLMAAMEKQASIWGNETRTLKSTMTARQFYLGLGYDDNGAPEPSFGRAVAYPMRRQLITPH